MKLIRLLCLSSLAALVACGGGSVPTPQAPAVTVTVPTKVVPIKVLATSYENKNDILLDDPKLPHLSKPKGQVWNWLHGLAPRVSCPHHALSFNTV